MIAATSLMLSAGPVADQVSGSALAASLIVGYRALAPTYHNFGAIDVLASQFSLATSQVTPGRASIWLMIAASALACMIVSPSRGRTSNVASAASPPLPSLFSITTFAPVLAARYGAIKRA